MPVLKQCKGQQMNKFSIHKPRAGLRAGPLRYLSKKKKKKLGKIWLGDERKFFIETFQPVNPEGMTELEHHHFVTPREIMIKVMIKINLS